MYRYTISKQAGAAVPLAGQAVECVPVHYEQTVRPRLSLGRFTMAHAALGVKLVLRHHHLLGRTAGALWVRAAIILSGG